MGEVVTLPGVEERQLDRVCERLLALTNPLVKGDEAGAREHRERTLRALVEILRGRRPDALLVDLFDLDPNTRMAVGHLLSVLLFEEGDGIEDWLEETHDLLHDYRDAGWDPDA
jgi:hypothetical protein